MTANNTTPNTEYAPLVTYDILLGDSARSMKESYYVQSIEVEREVNRIGRAEIVLFDGDMAKQEFAIIASNDFKPGTSISIQLGYDRQNEVVFQGFILKAGVRIREGKHPKLVVECVDQAYRMTVGRRNRYHVDKTDSDVMHDLLQEYAEISAGKIETTKYRHPNLVQYYASDWDFLLSRAEANGLLVVSDGKEISIKKPAHSDKEVLTITYGTDLIASDLKVDAGFQLSEITARSWDFADQKLVEANGSEPDTSEQGISQVDGPALARMLSKKAVDLQSAGPLSSDELQAWADSQLLKSRLARVQGWLTIPGSFEVSLDTLVELTGMSDYLNGTAYVGAVVHRMEEGNWLTDLQVGAPGMWFAESSPNVVSPPAAGLLPAIRGLFTGKVKQLEGDPDGDYRVLVEVPLIRNGAEGIWARWSSAQASNGFGVFYLPEVGDEVVLGFLNEDPRFPIILNSLYSKKLPPPEEMKDANEIKGYVSREKMRLVLNEKEKSITLETPDGYRLILTEEKGAILLEDKHGNKMTMNDKGFQFETKKDFQVKASGKILLEATNKIGLSSRSNDLQMEAQNVKAKARVKAQLEGNLTELKGTAQLKVQGGIVRIN